MKFCSPIEEKLYSALPFYLRKKAKTQYRIGSYHADYAIVPYRLVIECDGYEWHSTKQQRAHDAKRDRFMALHGWTTLRFTGSEIWADTAGCVAEIEAMVKRRWWWVFWG